MDFSKTFSSSRVIILQPSGIIWVKFDNTDVGEKTRHENRQLYVTGIEPTWTPIKPVTAEFKVSRTRSVQVVRKQFPLRPAAARTIHRAQGDTEARIVVNFETRRAIPHIHCWSKPSNNFRGLAYH